jgi:hypothetical protein
MRLWDGVEDARVLAEEGIEVWAPVHVAPLRYFVSNLGNLMSNVAGRGLRKVSPSISTSGRPNVGIYVNPGDRESVNWLVYRLMLWAFDGPPPTEEHTDACHGPLGESDNRLCSLRWGTRSENMQDVLKHKREKVRERIRTMQKATDKEWYPGLTADTELVEVCIDLYNQKKIEAAEIATLLRCSVDIVRGILSGRSLSHVHRPEGFNEVNRRKGENHRSTKFTDAQIREALSLYVQNHWSCRQFAEHLGMKPITADAVLVGRNWAHIPRPEGFKYPWPDAHTMNKRVGSDHGCAKVSEEKVRETFQKIMEGELTSMRAVAAHLGLAKGPAYSIVRGDSWPHVPRPEGFSEAVAKIQRKIMSSEEQQAILADFAAGVPRGEIQKKYDLPHDKLHYYAKKAQRIQQEATAG